MRYISTFTDNNLVVGVAAAAGLNIQHDEEQYGAHRDHDHNADQHSANQHSADDYAAFEIQCGQPRGPLAQIAVVASGTDQQGHAAAATELLVHTVYNSLWDGDSSTQALADASMSQQLATAVAQAIQQLHQRIAGKPALRDLGIAVTAVALVEETLYLAYVGNCHVYLVRNQTIQRLTGERTAAYDLDTQGTHAAFSHDARLQIGRATTIPIRTAIATFESHQVDRPTSSLSLEQGDVIVLCTAGLTTVLNEQTIAATVTAYPAQEAALVLANQASSAGATESHTVLILQRGDHQPSHVAPPIRPIAARWPQLSRTILLAALILVVLTVSWPVLSPHIGTQIQRMVGILPDVWVAAQEHIVIRLNETVGAIGKAAGAVGEGDTTISASTNLPAAGPPAVEQPAVASIATAQTSPTTSTAMLAGNSGLTLGTKAGDAFTGSTIRPAIMMEWAPILAMALANGAGRVAGTNTMTELSPIVALINQIVGNQAIGDTVNDIQLQAAPALAVAGSTISYTATNTVVPDTSTATPIPTGTPTATPIPPTPPPPTPLPTNTARAVQPTRRPATPTPIPSPSPAFIDLASANVTIIEPDVGDTLAGKRPFRWKANFSLPPGYAFEVIFWRHGQDALTQGKGYAGSTTDTTLNAEANNFRIRNAPEGEYQWGVILIRAEPYQRVKFLGGGQVIYVRR